MRLYNREMSFEGFGVTCVCDLKILDFLFPPRFLFLELIVKLFWWHTALADVSHVHCFVVGVSSQLVLLVLVVEIGNVIVADPHRLVIRPTEKHARLSQIYQCNHIGLLLDEVVLREFVV